MATNALHRITREYFNKNFMIRYYPEPARQWKNKLISLDTFKDIINNDEVYDSQMQRIGLFKGDVLTIKLKRGIAFKIVSR